MTGYAPGAAVLIDDRRNGDDITRRASVVHRMSACPDCGSERYHCRIVENDEDVHAAHAEAELSGFAVPIALCPLCGHTLDRAECLGAPTERPSPGDWTVCIACTAILEFDQQLKVTLVPFAIANRALADDPDLLRTVRAIQVMHRELGPPPQGGRPN